MKFWIDKDGFIYLFQLLKGAGAVADYREASFAIKHGQVMVNEETSFKQRHVLKNGDTIRYKKLHVKIMERDELGRTDEEAMQEKKPEGAVKHGKLAAWGSKPIQTNKLLEEELANWSRKLHEKLSSCKRTVSFAESCTGGMVQEMVTQYSGASEYFMGGIVSYSDQVKAKVLKVKQKTLDSYGAVSQETASEMAQNCAHLFQTDIAASVTGIAGPGGGSDEKPVGTVHIAVWIGQDIFHKKFLFSGTRDIIRKKSTLNLFQMILENL